MFEFENELKLLGRLSPGEIRAWRKKRGMHQAVSDLAKKGLYFVKLTFPKHCTYPDKSRSDVIKESVSRLVTLLNTSHDRKALLLASPYCDVFLAGTASTVLNNVFSYKGWSSHVWPENLVEHSSFRGAIGMAILIYAIYINKSIECGDYNLAITQISDAFSILILDGEKKHSIKNKENRKKLDEMPALVLRERAKEGAKARLLKDKRQSEKAFVLSCWMSWRQSPTNYKSKAAFSRDMLEKCQSLTSQKKIEDWCREWEKSEPS